MSGMLMSNAFTASFSPSFLEIKRKGLSTLSSRNALKDLV